MNSLRDYAQTLSQTALLEIHKSYEKFEIQGFIGDEACRTYAEGYLLSIKMAPDYHIAMFMQLLAFEVYRLLALPTIGHMEAINADFAGTK